MKSYSDHEHIGKVVRICEMKERHWQTHSLEVTNVHENLNSVIIKLPGNLEGIRNIPNAVYREVLNMYTF